MSAEKFWIAYLIASGVAFLITWPKVARWYASADTEYGNELSRGWAMWTAVAATYLSAVAVIFWPVLLLAAVAAPLVRRVAA